MASKRTTKKPRSKAAKNKFEDPRLFINRELSWIAFNRRVLEEAETKSNPLLERVKFACIVSSNFDEFFMVRVAGLKHQVAEGQETPCPAGLTPRRQLERIAERVHRIVNLQQKLVCEELLPALREEGIRILPRKEWDVTQQGRIRSVYEQQIYPVLTPIDVDRRPAFPLLENLKLNLAALVEAEPDEPPHLVVIPVPSNLPRLLPIHDAYVWLEDVIAEFIGRLAAGKPVLDLAAFRITRDAELEFDDEGGDGDFLATVEQELRKRRKNRPVRLEISASAGPRLAARLRAAVEVEDRDVYYVKGPIDIRPLMMLLDLPGFDHLKNPPFEPQTPPELIQQPDIWELLQKQDVLLHHPYDSFDPIVELMTKAADDPLVLAIKQTLYRTSGQSPVIAALSRAAQNNKQVTVLVELMARFDEEQNVNWAKKLEEDGAHVIYGVQGLKTHSKILLIVRREPEGIRRYVHLGTGNYNDKTAKLYTDMGLLTSRGEYGADASAFFNTITGLSDAPEFNVLTMAPQNLRERFLALIRREAERASNGQKARIWAKMNSLVDKDIIIALYKASEAGVEIKLNVRGICCLRPGVEGVSENIEVVSIVDRFLEHSRIYYFFNGGQEEVYLSSADWMPRNLDKRVELMFPIEEPHTKEKAIEALRLFFADNVRARKLTRAGRYVRKKPAKGQRPIRCQVVFFEQAKQAAENARVAIPLEFRPQRKHQH